MITTSNVIPIGTALDPFEAGLTQSQIAARIRANGGKCTDGPLSPANAVGSWAKSGSPAQRSKVAHLITGLRRIGLVDEREAWEAETRCGGVVIVAAGIAPLLRPGNWPYCKRCERAGVSA